MADLPTVCADTGLRGEDGDQLLRQLYQAHAPALDLFLSQWTLDDRRANEVLVRTTLLRASRTLERIGDPGLLRPWLFTLARRVVIEFYRSRRNRVVATAEREGDTAAALRAVTGQMRGGHVALALGRIGPEHRRILIELFYRCRTVQETARLLGVPEAVVTSRADDALRALRSALATTSEVARCAASA